MFRGLAIFLFVCGSTAALIAYPGLLWVWGAAMGIVVLLTLPESKPRTRVVKPAKGKAR